MLHLKALINWLNTLDPSQSENPSFHYFEQEVGWILTTLTNGPNPIVEALFYQKVGENDSVPNPDLGILEFISRCLISKDVSRNHIALWITSNSSAESTNIASMIANNLPQINIYDAFHKIVATHSVKKEMLELVLWNLQNLFRMQAFP